MFLAAVASLALLAGAPQEAAPGQLTTLQRDGKPGALCPLKGTTVNADIAGYGARVTVVQTFTNPSAEPIEAVYTFPLPNDAAVDRMRMRIGDRIIAGVIKKKDEARTIYETAKAQGQIAGLLDQERPNVFTQSVANIMPGAKIEIEISYVQLLKFEEGQFEFNFPMVVGPRYLPNTPDPGKVAPPITPKDTRTGADIKLTVNLDAGAPIADIKSVLHTINTKKVSDSRAVITLARKNEIPNRDFILRYRCSTGTVTGALLTHASKDKGGFFSLILLPPQAPTAQQIAPKEVIFVMDQSGSQRGFPIDKSKELTAKLIDKLNPGDTFNVISFSNDVHWLWPSPSDNTPSARADAKKFVEGLQANGGTELFKAVTASLTPTEDPKRIRVVLFNTDGFVGNEFQILQGIKEYRHNSRMFTFGIGNSVNRFLIDAMSYMGKGDAEYVTLAEKADEAVARFIQRVDKPILTHVSVSFEGVAVQDCLPAAIPDVFSDKPVIVKGRYANPGKGYVVISGRLGSKPWSDRIAVDFPATDQCGSAIASLWARAKVEDLMRDDWIGQVSGTRDSKSQAAIEALGLEFGLMTQHTSFVAVEQKIVNVGGKQKTVAVPVEMPEGVSYEGIFRDAKTGRPLSRRAGAPAGNANLAYLGAQSGGAGGGSGGFVGGAPPAASPATTAGVPMLREASKSKDSLDKGDGAAAKPLSAAEKKQYNFESRVALKLRALKSGKVEIQIWLKEWKDADIEKLKKAGFKLDDKDKSLKVLFGTCDVAKLKEIAQIDSVVRIEPLQ